MSTITIIGKGNMGSAISGIFEKAGQTVQVLDSSDGSVAVTGDIDVRRARELEAIGFLGIKLAAAEKINWTGGFAVQA